MNSRLRVAILGANGFIGSRLVELYHLEGRAEVRPVVRRASALASASRFQLNGYIANAFDQSGLETAFDGCDTVIHAVTGDPGTIVGSVIPVYNAAEKMGCRRLIYLSSASVHGQSPAPNTKEDTPLSARQPIAYNNAKVTAERLLDKLCRTGRLEVVVLRPGIVYGPRSAWIAGVADDLLNGQAYLVDGGSGICNSIYVDNLAEALWLALRSTRAAGRAYLLGDRETITWRQFYQPIVNALGIDISQVPTVKYQNEAFDLIQQLGTLRDSRIIRGFSSKLPYRLREGLGAFVSAVTSERLRGTRPIAPTLEVALLHTCSIKLPCDRARDDLGYEPQIAFKEACRRSTGWLAFAGYPVIPSN